MGPFAGGVSRLDCRGMSLEPGAAKGYWRLSAPIESLARYGPGALGKAEALGALGRD